MKAVAIIMAFIFLALNLMPCADSGSVLTNVNVDITHNKIPHEQGHDDDCSPFCSCTCCAGFAFYYSVPALHTVPVFTNYTSDEFILSKPVEVVFSFWQPPRYC